MRAKHIIGHFDRFFEGAKTFVIPKLSTARCNAVAEKPPTNGRLSVLPAYKKITSQTFKISGTLVVFVCPLELDIYHLAHEKIREIWKIGIFNTFFWGRCIRQQDRKFMTILFLWHPWTTSSPTEKSAAFQGEYSALFKTMPHTVLTSFRAILVLLDLDQDPVSARKCGFRNKIVFTSWVVKQHTHLPPPPPPNPHKPSVKGQIKP